MAANTKRPPRDASGMYLRASRYYEDLQEEARSLRRAGKIRAAKGVEGRVHHVERLLGALEGESPNRTPTSSD